MASASVLQSLLTSTTLASSVPSSTASSTPLTILIRDSIEGTSDFFPFRDIAGLGSGSDDVDSGLTFKELFATSLDGNQEITLFSSGCQVDGRTDCTRACNNSSLFFSSLETFYNCAALAAAAHWTQDAKSYYVSQETERNASAIMGSGTLSEFDGRPVLRSLIACAQDSCDNDGLSKPCNRTIDRLSYDTSTPEEIFEALDEFCPELPAEVNPDIFGPGVLISYVLQVCFAASLYLLLKGFTLWVTITQDTSRRKSEPKPYRLKRSLTRIESMIWRDSGGLSRTSIAIATTLVEFQEAQCWFVFAVQIASILAIVVNSQEGTFWGEIVVNAAIAFHLSLNGILSMFLIQVCLHHEGIRNWHTFLGFFMEYLLAIVATSQKIYFKDAFALFKSQNQIEACGFNPSPRTYCAATQGIDGQSFSFFPHPLLYKMTFLILDTIAIIALVADQLAWTLRKHHLTKHVQIGSYRLGRWPRWGKQKRGLFIKIWFWRILEVAYLVINILYMISLTKVINAESFAANRWSYGQIIAVTVWGPVIVKLFDLLLCTCGCIVPYTGRSKQTTLVKGKPTPVGFKIWVIAQQGYFLQWLWHVKASPVTAITVKLEAPKPYGKKGKLRTETPLSNTQSVVVHLLKRLTTATYHVFTDNLFSSPQLFRLLRQLGHGATGTARPNCGITAVMKQIKETGKKPDGTPLVYNKVYLIPTKDKQKDSSVVLFLTTVHGEAPLNRTPKKRKLPAKRGTKAEAQRLKEVFNGDQARIIPIPSVAAQYNDEMNHVDRGDQIRSYTSYQHRFRRGPWQALLWSFLLDVALANSFILQKKTRQPRWKPYSTLRDWKEAIYNAIFNKYGTDSGLRKRCQAEKAPLLAWLAKASVKGSLGRKSEEKEAIYSRYQEISGGHRLAGPPKNGMRLNSGPPRLRIDNVINGRVGTSAVEVIEDDNETDEKCDEPAPRARDEGFMIRQAATMQLGDSNHDGRDIEGEAIETWPKAASPEGISAERDVKGTTK
ncbi:hypothetical protein HZS61_012118 [Fusarium oxysporum f. sp. conglutinans]|uniref:PiggyBac transposable element-derived protein domain-containing protein n=3 Tax=Fusarium oxysporum f. sp. conglutinans TaxID=100902 RepID=A0A8H6GRV7_FUSOX|nr:hypothetical protein HZS61_012118 [Fusarium oxysporum f. sp. conglutinans]